MHTYCESDSKSFSLVGMTSLGTRGVLLKLDRNNLIKEVNPLYDFPLSPEDLLAHYQLAFWPIGALQETYSDNKYRVFDRKNSLRRLLFKEGKLFLEVSYNSIEPWDSNVDILNIENGYILRIETSTNG